MSLTDKNLLLEKPHIHAFIGGVQRIYRFKGGGLSAVNGKSLHNYPFAWEIAVLKGVSDSGEYDDLDYSTPLTEDVEVFDTDEEANAFIEKARKYFEA